MEDDPVIQIGVLRLVGAIKDLPNRAADKTPISIIFNGRNFPEWRERIQDVLMRERIWKKVSRLNRPLKGKELDDFLEDQMVAKSTIRGYMEAAYLHLVDPHDDGVSVKEMLDQIAAIYDWKNSKKGKFAFLIASASTNHIVNDPYLARDFKPCRAELQAICGDPVIATARGDLNLRSEEGYKFTLKNVLFAPDIVGNFFSVRSVPLAVSFTMEGVQLIKGNSVIASGSGNNVIDFYVE